MKRKLLMTGGGLVGLVILGGGLTLASGGSVPGQPLYPIKRAGENLRLAVSFTPNLAADTHFAIASQNVKELEKLGRTKGSGMAFTRSSNQLTEHILGAENNIMLIKLKGRGVGKYKEELCDGLEDYQKRLEPISDAVPPEARDPYKNVMTAIGDGISKSMGW